LLLNVYYGGEKTNSYLYEDEGDGYDYEKGIYNTKRFKVQCTETSMKLSLKSNGHYEPDYSTYKLIIHGIPFTPSGVLLNEKMVESAAINTENNTLTVIAERISFITLEILQ
jgi:alpha-glucosidase